MQKSHSKQRKEISGKGNGEFRLVTILHEIIVRKEKQTKTRTNQNKT